MKQIALLGFGTVGLGVYEIINLKRGAFFSSNDAPAKVKWILVRDINKRRTYKPTDCTLTDNFQEIINDDEVDIVISAMGGMEPEYTYIKEALKRKKHVVTANKEVICAHIDELTNLAKENGVKLYYEGAVGGGIPIISSIIETLKINKITKIQGILNGTTNFILTKMSKEKADFAEVLKVAQELGFAEADPTADIEGYDVMRKICILASLAFHTHAKTEDVHLRGISNITLDDVNMADSMGYDFKYIGQALLKDDKYSISVTPVLLPKDSVMCNVNQEYNVIMLYGDIIGELCFMGKGAGKDATANAVVSDAIKAFTEEDTQKHINFNETAHSYGLSGIKNQYYIRATVNNYEQFESTIDCAADTIKKNNLTYTNSKVFFTTELINSSDMLALYEKLKTVSEDVFYARMEHNLL
ncbi:MAG: homoserine dehydrogenase [Anaerofustis stercorihominis]|nr:homoserine dehydrogenase [Anaerofustis stercorihominis]